MISSVYVEKEISKEPRTKEICRRFDKLEIIECDHYGEIFNRKAQNFRLQKSAPALLLAKKYKGYVLPAPAAYGIGGDVNYYFSHMMNCVYDCRYCFLQGMYRSANYVLFVNFEDFAEEIKKISQRHRHQTVYFFSGYDCDSLALEPVTRFVEFILPVFECLENAYLELRTKSTQIRHLIERPVLDNCIVAFSLSPDNIVNALEDKTPTLGKRLDAMRKLQKKGWKIGLRFDPLIYFEAYQAAYAALFQRVFKALNVNSIHSVSLGGFRMPENFFKNIVKLYPEEKLFACWLDTSEGMVSYANELAKEMQ
ncbi:MAG TPA: DNA photolyase, partial [Gammaproteobacteria bacterium]|nr:DNA photolyase [Gammaproteobacteria bacterium]